MRSEPGPVPMCDQLAPPSVLDQRPPFGLMLPPLATATMISSLPGTWHMLLRLPHGAWVGSPAKLFVTLIHLPLDGLLLLASGAGAPLSTVPLASIAALEPADDPDTPSDAPGSVVVSVPAGSSPGSVASSVR